jgi:hypothetical protein
VKDPVKCPDESIVQTGVTEKRFEAARTGLMVHAPASPATKLEPETETLVPVTPDAGVNVTAAVAPTVKSAEAVSAATPVTLTRYAPFGTAPTVNDPATVPSEFSVQLVTVRSPAGLDVKEAQAAEAELKPAPATETTTPAPPLVGFRTIWGTTKKPVEAESPPGPVTVIV